MQKKDGLKGFQMNKVLEAQKFFDEVVRELMLADLNNLVMKIPAIPNTGGNCNFPIALFIFSCVEFLGYLTSEELIEGGNDYTKKRVFSYINDFFDKKYQDQVFENEATFVDVFRHGLSHEFFAKGAGISRDKGVLLGKNQEDILILSADEFYDAFRLSTQILYQKVSTNENNVADRICERYASLLDKNKKKFQYNSSGSKPSISTSAPSIAPPLKSVSGTGTVSYPMEGDNN